MISYFFSSQKWAQLIIFLDSPPELINIINVLENEVTENSSSEDIQTLLYEVGKKHEFDNLKDFFKLVYQVMLGQDQGPRLGSFFKLFGLRETIDYLKKLIDN